MIISYVHRNKSLYICHIRQVISFLKIIFVTRKIGSGTTRFPPPLHLFCPRYDQIPGPCHPPLLSCQECFHIFFCFDPISQFTNCSQTSLQWHCIILSTHSVLNAIPMGDGLIQVWLYWTIIFVLTSSIKPKLYSWLTPSPLISLIFPKLLTVGFFWKLSMQEWSNYLVPWTNFYILFQIQD